MPCRKVNSHEAAKGCIIIPVPFALDPIMDADFGMFPLVLWRRRKSDCRSRGNDACSDTVLDYSGAVFDGLFVGIYSTCADSASAPQTERR